MAPADEEGSKALGRQGGLGSARSAPGRIPSEAEGVAAPLPPAPGRSRSRARDDAARAALVPLGEGERPAAVTVGALVAAALGLGTVVAHVAALAGGGQRQPLALVVGQSLLMLALAWGMWRVRYWAVLGMQAVLGLVIVIFSLLAPRAESLGALLLGVAIVASAGALFWVLVRAMARIQMPAGGDSSRPP